MIVDRDCREDKWNHQAKCPKDRNHRATPTPPKFWAKGVYEHQEQGAQTEQERQYD
jgi:hypothetical protein